ncbi:FadR family transcriptional regulator [Alloscardovia theropitheci]|uniref:FadR family transcriptional regulator n=1 Tax=Alloscardovia theropitheci TaxID=2496842 RepID=A0A4V6N6W5_9BIFI|nr:GntR family transcriptional regulator [Alloscardovia theropitheci]TCD54259.1 FadR family transcriptional regulator [Alloscardovia theropitheci]
MDSLHDSHSLDSMSVSGITNSLTSSPAEQLSNRRRVDTTMDAIKAYIIQQGLQPGDPLPTESYLCEYLKSARSSVREALRKLEALDIVNVIHGKGTFVGSLSLEPLVEALSFRAMIPHGDTYNDLEDIIELRKILDQGLAPQVISAVQQLSDDEVNHLRDLIEQMNDRASHGHTFLEQDSAFHQGLLQSVNNSIALQLTQSLWLVHMAVVPALNADISLDLKLSASSHADILDSALKGDIQAYQQAIATHYQPIERIIHAHMK